MIGEKIKELREKKGLTREELGRLLGITSVMIQYIEKEKRGCTSSWFHKLPTVLDCSFAELFGEIPINFKDINSVKYVDNINNYSTIEELENNSVVYAISNELLKLLGINKNKNNNILITKVSNNSMYDLISPTDEIVIDLNDKEFVRDDIYLIKEQGRLEIRLLTILKEENKINSSMFNKKFIGNLSSNFERSDANQIIFGKIIKIIKNTN